MDMVSYVIRKFLPGPVEAVVRTDRGARVRGDWRLHRCHHPRCSDVNVRRERVEAHIRKKQGEMAKDIKALGWFWGTIHAMIKENPRTTIAEALGRASFFECRMEVCRLPFQTATVLAHHFSQIHAAYTQEGWETSSRHLNQELVQVDMDQSNREENVEENQRQVVEANGMDVESAGSRVPPNEVESDGNIRIDTDVEVTGTLDDASTQNATIPVPWPVDTTIVGLERQRIRRNNRERQRNEQEQERRRDQPRRRPRGTRQ
jgi:hypothetical protein